MTGQKFAEAKTRLSQQTFAILVVAGRMFEDSNVFFLLSGPTPDNFFGGEGALHCFSSGGENPSYATETIGYSDIRSCLPYFAAAGSL